MKKILISLVCSVLCLSSCDTNSNGDACGRVETLAPQSEVVALESYIYGNSISAVKDERGFFYIINRAGTADRPNVCSNVTVSYTGRLTSGAQFDAANNVTMSLARLIVGWQEGVPLIGEGGSITLYLPPSFGYGSQAVTGIPPNSITVFTIDLIDVL